MSQDPLLQAVERSNFDPDLQEFIPEGVQFWCEARVPRPAPLAGKGAGYEISLGCPFLSEDGSTLPGRTTHAVWTSRALASTEMPALHAATVQFRRRCCRPEANMVDFPLLSLRVLSSAD